MIKSKKRFLLYILCVGIVFLFGVIALSVATDIVPAFAEELPQEDSENLPEKVVELSEEHTFFGRIWEWITANATEILTVIGDVILIVCIIFQKFKSKKKIVEFGTNLLSVKDEVANTATSQRNVIKVTNELIEGYNKFEKAINNFDAVETERYKSMLAAFAQTKAILEILTTVYANSKNIPQGVKDLINLKYAAVLKFVETENNLQDKDCNVNSYENFGEFAEPEKG